MTNRKYEIMMMIIITIILETANYTLPVIREACFCILNIQFMNGLKRSFISNGFKNLKDPSSSYTTV